MSTAPPFVAALLTLCVLASTGLAACTPAPSSPAPAAPSGAASAPAPAAGGSAPQAAPPPAAPEAIKVAIPIRALGYLGLFVAQSKGFFTAEGLAPEIIVMGSDLQPPALQSGEIDYAGASGTIGRAALAGIPVKLVVFLYERPTWSLVARPEITTAAQLRGRPVGITRVRTSTDYAARLALTHFGLNPDTDVSIVPVGVQPLQSLEAGVVDAAILNFDLVGPAKARGYNELVNIADLAVWPFSGFGVSDRKLAQQREQVKRYVRAQVKAIQYMLDHEPEVVQVAAQEFDLQPDAARSPVAAALHSIGRTNIGGTNNEGIARFIDFELKEGLPPEATVQPSQFLDLTILDEVQRELGIRRP
jgi:NitT/TauT family transport system substrate-binding protein